MVRGPPWPSPRAGRSGRRRFGRREPSSPPLPATTLLLQSNRHVHSFREDRAARGSNPCSANRWRCRATPAHCSARRVRQEAVARSGRTTRWRPLQRRSQGRHGIVGFSTAAGYGVGRQAAQGSLGVGPVSALGSDRWAALKQSGRGAPHLKSLIHLALQLHSSDQMRFPG